MATDFGRKELHFIQHAGILKWIRISQFQFTGVKGNIFATFFSKFHSDRSSIPRDFAASFCNFLDETANIDISYQISRKYTRPNFTDISSLVDTYGNYKTDIDIIFAVTQGTLLW